jgi:hypothetical protein
MALTNLEKLRIELADTEPGLFILDDDTLEYFLEKNNDSIPRATLDAAKTILLKLAQTGSETVDIFSIRGEKAAEQYRLALQLFIRDPNLNPLIKNIQGWVGGISKTEMLANQDTVDNNIVKTPGSDPLTTSNTGYF